MTTMLSMYKQTMNNTQHYYLNHSLLWQDGINLYKFNQFISTRACLLLQTNDYISFSLQHSVISFKQLKITTLFICAIQFMTLHLVNVIEHTIFYCDLSCTTLYLLQYFVRHVHLFTRIVSILVQHAPWTLYIVDLTFSIQYYYSIYTPVNICK